jgi:hypothetical protein
MPSAAQHDAQATSNLSFLDSFYKVHQFNDWTVTVSFYSAVHIIEGAIFKTKKLLYSGVPIFIEHSEDLPKACGTASVQPPKNYTPGLSTHWKRKTIVTQNFGPVATEYRFLYNKSLSARYEVYIFSNYEALDMIAKLKKIITWANNTFSTSFSLS